MEKGGHVGEAEAKEAYKAARKDTDDDATDVSVDDKVSSALIDRVIVWKILKLYISCTSCLFITITHFTQLKLRTLLF